MGEASRRLATFKAKHAMCCFCGGTVPTQTIEHAPPRILFLNKQRPKSHEFPACERCNHGSSSGDQISAMAAFMMGSALNPKLPEQHFSKLYKGVKNNHPDVLSYFSTPGENVYGRSNGLILPMVQTEVDRRLFRYWLNPWAAKLGYALWYEHTKEIMSANGAVGVRWMTNESLVRGQFPHSVFEQLGFSGEIKQGGWNVSDQFFYRYGHNKEEGFAFFMPILFESCGILIYAFKDGKSMSRFPKMSVFQTNELEGIHQATVIE